MEDDSDVFAINPFHGLSDEETATYFEHMDAVELLLVVGTYLLTATKGEQGVSVSETLAEIGNIMPHELAVKCFKWTDQLVIKAQLNKRKN